MEGLVTLNRVLIRGLLSFNQVFGGRAHFSASFPLLTFVKSMSLLNPYLDPDSTGRGFTPWLTRQGLVEASTCECSDASLQAQKLDKCLA